MRRRTRFALVVLGLFSRSWGPRRLTFDGILIGTAALLIVAFAVFVMVKQTNRFMAPPPPAATRNCPKCLSSIPIGATRCSACCADL